MILLGKTRALRVREGDSRHATEVDQAVKGSDSKNGVAESRTLIGVAVV